jgi:hypothetical protein
MEKNAQTIRVGHNQGKHQQPLFCSLNLFKAERVFHLGKVANLNHPTFLIRQKTFLAKER